MLREIAILGGGALSGGIAVLLFLQEELWMIPILPEIQIKHAVALIAGFLTALIALFS